MTNANLHAFGQLCLLADHLPDGSEIPIAQRVITRGCLLPVPANEVIDIKRVCKILDMSTRSVIRLIHDGSLRGFQLDVENWSVVYASIVEYCDQLRLKHHIADRRPKLKPGFRWRDEDLLPFPLRDTVYVKDAMLGLDTHRRRVLHLCEEGRFDCYQIRTGKKCPWRISKTSLLQWAEKMRRSV